MTSQYPTNLNEFRKWLKQSGVRMRGIQHWRLDSGAPLPNFSALFYSDRTIFRVSKDEFVFADGQGSTMGIPAPGQIAFDGDKVTFTYKPSGNTITYQMINPIG